MVSSLRLFPIPYVEMFMIKEPNKIHPFGILENSNIDLHDMTLTENEKSFKSTFDLENRIYKKKQPDTHLAATFIKE